MDLGSILLIFSVFLLVAVFIGKPVLDRRVSEVSESDQTRSSLLAEREQLLDTLQELDFDFKLGKIPENVYPVQRTRLLQRGAEILKKLDAVDEVITARRPQVSDAVEKAIADRRKAAGAGPKQPVAADDDVERLIAARKRDRNDRTAGFCPNCGQAVLQTDKFCSKCGHTLS